MFESQGLRILGRLDHGRDQKQRGEKKESTRVLVRYNLPCCEMLLQTRRECPSTEVATAVSC